MPAEDPHSAFWPTGKAQPPVQRDYSLTGPYAKRAVEIGLASAEWYHSEVPRKAMKELIKRTDGPAIRDTIIWRSALLFAAGGIYFCGTYGACRSCLVYGVLYGRPATAAGTNAATARPFAPAG